MKTASADRHFLGTDCQEATVKANRGFLPAGHVLLSAYMHLGLIHIPCNAFIGPHVRIVGDDRVLLRLTHRVEMTTQ